MADGLSAVATNAWPGTPIARGAFPVILFSPGYSEPSALYTALLEDLGQRGLDTTRPTLLVLDGSKALHAAVTRVWGRHRAMPALIKALNESAPAQLAGFERDIA